MSSCSVAPQESKLTDNQYKKDYVLSGKIERVKEHSFGEKQLYFMEFSLKKPYIVEYTISPGRTEKVIPINWFMKELLPAHAIVSLPEKNEVFFVNTKQMSIVNGKTLLFKFFASRKIHFDKNSYYNLRFLSMGEDEDLLFFSQKGAVFSKTKNEDYKIVIKGIRKGYIISKNGIREILPSEIKETFSTMNKKVFNGDIVFSKDAENCIGFQIKGISFNEKVGSITARIQPLIQQSNKIFFKKIKEEKVFNYPVDFHIDPKAPRKPRL